MKKLLFICVMMLVNILSLQAQKREFRGAWIQCVNGQFNGMSTEKMQNYLTWQLDELKKMHCNAVIFQIRPEFDALYPSEYEPWSRFMTGEQGKPPYPYWDPLGWMVEQCHKRGMELHAWINPYRVKTKTTTVLAQNNYARLHPERVFNYDGMIIANPALQENRDYICTIVTDILQRYDVDGLHIDDYFYPYPVAGQTIDDEREFRMFSNGIADKGDWRRYNVDLLIKALHETIRRVKPWVKFGVSPFGIYRNKKNDPNGSNTNGLQNYDDLYADVLKWVNNGWIDYNVPQLYWEIGHKAADYDELIHWWNKNAANRPLFIGEDIERTVKNSDPNNPNQNQQPAKYALHRQLVNVDGTVLWYSKVACDNVGNYASLLANKYWKTPALQPSMTFIERKAPGKVKKLKAMWIDSDYVLFWTPAKDKSWADKAAEYVIYRFANGEKTDLNDATKIVAITTDTYYKLPYSDGKTKYTYVVTALNRIHNESKTAKKKIKL